MTTSEWGSVREIWTGPLTGTGPSASFLINDAVTHEQSAPVSRNLRLGDSVDTGPYSTFTQSSWVGGAGAQQFEDKQMFWHSLRADTRSAAGRIQHWPGWRNVLNIPNNPGNGTVVKLWSGLKATGVPATTCFWAGAANGDITRFDSFGSAATLVGNVGSAITCVSQVGENDGVGIFDKFFIGTAAGNFFYYDAGANVFLADGTCPGNTGIQGVCTLRNVTYVMLRSTGTANDYPMLYKRTRAGGVTTWTKMWDFTQMARTTDIKVWNGTLYISGVTDANETIVYSSDGTTAVEAFRIADFQVKRLQVHYGSLYLGGDSIIITDDTFPQPLRHTKIYKYNGTSLTALFDQGHGMRDTLGYGTPFGEMLSWGKYLAWTRDYCSLQDLNITEFASMVGEPGLMLYDAENDAIHVGPSLVSDPAGVGTPDHVYVTGFTIVDDRPVLAFKDTHNYGGGVVYPLAIGVLRSEGYVRNINFGYGGKSFEAQQNADLSAKVFTAEYDGGLVGENKVWLTAVVRFKLPQSGGTVKVTAYTETDSSVQTFSYAGLQLGWRTERVLLTTATGDALQGKTLRVAIEVIDSRTTNDQRYHTVDLLAVQFVLAPKARRQWRFQVNISDNQLRLDGTPNASTGTALVTALKALWSSGKPFYLWLPKATGGTPPNGPGDAIVQLIDYSWLSYRDDSLGTKVDGAMSITLLEAV